MTRTDVLIVGAGPTGLVLALWLTRQGINVRIIDKSEAKASTSRAMAIHARTLELYRQLDLAEDVVANGHKIAATNIWAGGVHRSHVPFGDLGAGLTPYPFIHIYPQDQHERLLEALLNTMGVHVERNRELVEYQEKESFITAQLRNLTKPHIDNDDMETCEAAFIVGCDGARSAVRQNCGIGFEGATYSKLFYVADIEGSGPSLNGQAHLSLNDKQFFLLMAYDNDRHARLNGAVDESALTKDLSDLTLDDVAPDCGKAVGVKIDKVNWFSIYHVHHRVAEAFRSGRAFLVGDAAHIHSPVGGQGMNTGIGDAINLAWKLAAVIQDKADMSLLDSYEAERRAFAALLVNTTDTAFNAIASEGYLSHFIRTWFIPYVSPILSKFGLVRQRVFRGVSQIMLNYRDSALSTGSAGTIQGGDRIPWAPVGELDNFQSLKEITWQVHVYGEAKDMLKEWCNSKGIPLHIFPWSEKYQSVGLGKDAAYLVRPDTYVAVAEASGLPEQFDQYLKDNKIRL
ncbi:FAD binding domain-containing protein [Aspergillus pseudotamarii]|uniref:FAD binding domain-containing protein n=1 Tax=Aspergillus pseudotamarii TaxID=132259 RepID=A0A5N6SU22_ASPPS|nr:FAD binding domain-containing protein [Aspergillus pseudotamarii]KAE8137281.1 FAD binding domain-containing protein [Aspergillus pseudotamarii]